MRLREARILLVDDEPLLLEIFVGWLTVGDKPRLISTAADGQEALKRITENTYDLVITDVKMPRMDGVTLVRHLSQLDKALPTILFVSGLGKVDEREMYGLGVEAFLEKPVTRETLIRALERALAERCSLWRERMKIPPRQSILIEALDFRENSHDGGIVLGRGGLTAPYKLPVALGGVCFDCHLSVNGSRITGEGFIRWRSKAEGVIGIEFAFLEESCRAAIAETIENKNPRAFIPTL